MQPCPGKGPGGGVYFLGGGQILSFGVQKTSALLGGAPPRGAKLVCPWAVGFGSALLEGRGHCLWMVRSGQLILPPMPTITLRPG